MDSCIMPQEKDFMNQSDILSNGNLNKQHTGNNSIISLCSCNKPTLENESTCVNEWANVRTKWMNQPTNQRLNAKTWKAQFPISDLLLQRYVVGFFLYVLYVLGWISFFFFATILCFSLPTMDVIVIMNSNHAFDIKARPMEQHGFIGVNTKTNKKC